MPLDRCARVAENRFIQIFRLIGIAAALGLAPAAVAQVPAPLMPRAIAGSGFNVRDLESEKNWYLDKLGMTLVDTFTRDGKPFEYILGYGGRDKAVLALLLDPARPAGANAMGRLILIVPDAAGLAAHLKAQGVPAREVAPGVAWFVTDPEGNPIELYTPRSPAK